MSEFISINIHMNSWLLSKKVWSIYQSINILGCFIFLLFLKLWEKVVWLYWDFIREFVCNKSLTLSKQLPADAQRGSVFLRLYCFDSRNSKILCVQNPNPHSTAIQILIISRMMDWFFVIRKEEKKIFSPVRNLYEGSKHS